jgi:thioredoxin-like negative regulator of GroEL
LDESRNGKIPRVTSDVAAAEFAPVAEKPRLVFFYGKTSGPCRRVDAFLSQVLQRRHNHDTFQLVRVCADNHPELVEYFGIDRLPAIFVISERRVKARVVAPKGRKELEQALAPWLT